jgi:uncharacterized protein YaaQ
MLTSQSDHPDYFSIKKVDPILQKESSYLEKQKQFNLNQKLPTSGGFLKKSNDCG